MARNRMIRPEFWEDAKMAKLTPMARLLYIALWNFADDEGYLQYDVDWIRIKCFPYEPNTDVSALLNELFELKRIDKNNGVIKIQNFLKYQRVEKPKKSDLKTQFGERSGKGSGEVGKQSQNDINSGRSRGIVAPEEKLSEVKRSEEEEKLKEVKAGEKEEKTGNEFPDPSSASPLKPETANGNGPKTAKPETEAIADSSAIIQPAMSWSEEVDMAVELGIEQNLAMRICNLGRSHRLGFTRETYLEFVGKTDDEVNKTLDIIIVAAGKRKSAVSGLASVSEHSKHKP